MKKSPLVLNSGRVGQLQTGDWIGAKDNIANSAPAVSNDSSEGYEVSSRWLDIVAQIEYICIDASLGAAVWVQVVGGGGGGGDYVQGVIDEADIDFGTGGPVDFLGAAFELQNLNGDIHVRAQIAFDDAGTTPTGVAIAFPSGTLPQPAVFGNTNLETIQGFARIYTGSSPFYIAGTAELIYNYPTPGRATISIRPYDGAWSGKTVQNAVVDIHYKSV